VVSGVFSSFGKGDQIKKLDLSLGLEYWYQNQFAVRAGYFYEDKNNGDRQYITCGLGLRYNVFELNAAYLVPQGSGITRNPLSNTLRFSLVFQFDKLEQSNDDTPADASSPDTGTSGQ
jgi:predicted porin